MKYQICIVCNSVSKSHSTVLNWWGVLFITERFDKTKQYPVIVVVHPGGGVKEQTVGVCVRKLTEVGFCSGDESRFGESPLARGRTVEAKGMELIMENYVLYTSEEAVSAPFAYACEAYDLYRTLRGMLPNSRKQIANTQFF